MDAPDFEWKGNKSLAQEMVIGTPSQGNKNKKKKKNNNKAEVDSVPKSNEEYPALGSGTNQGSASGGVKWDNIEAVMSKKELEEQRRLMEEYERANAKYK